MSDVFTVLRNLPVQPQVQCSLNDQAHALVFVAKRFGLDNIAAFIRENFAVFALTVPLNDVIDVELVQALPQQPVTKDGFQHQMKMAYLLANTFGLYDISDRFRLVV